MTEGRRGVRSRCIRLAAWAAAAAVATATAGVAAFEQVPAPATNAPPATVSAPAPDAGALALSGAIQSAVRESAEGRWAQGLLGVGEAGFEYLLPGLFDSLPAWLRHTEFDVQIQENNEPHWSVLTVIPLFETEDLQHTVFTQLSQRRYDLLGQTRDVTNAGLGYRRLLMDNRLLAGVNAFYDYEWDNEHQRTSAGLELKYGGLDLSANYYFGLSGSQTARRANIVEEPLDGYDIELTAQVPFVPWARLRLKRFVWETEFADKSVKSYVASMEADLHQNLQIEAGYTDDNAVPSEAFVNMRFVLQLDDRPVGSSPSFAG